MKFDISFVVLVYAFAHFIANFLHISQPTRTCAIALFTVTRSASFICFVYYTLVRVMLRGVRGDTVSALVPTASSTSTGRGGCAHGSDCMWKKMRWDTQSRDNDGPASCCDTFLLRATFGLNSGVDMDLTQFWLPIHFPDSAGATSIYTDARSTVEAKGRSLLK